MTDMKNTVLLMLLFVSLFSSCKDKDNSTETYSLVFHPRKCTYSAAVTKLRTTNIYLKTTYFEYLDVENNASIKSTDYVISVYTSNRGGENDLDSPVTSLEKEIKLDYNKYVTNSANSSSANKTKLYLSMIPMEYRTNGIVKLSISSIDNPLFGKVAGTSLNDYFEIVKYNPDFIASSESKSLIYGFSDTNKPATIDEWLSLSPLAQPTIYFRLNTAPDNLPLSVRFKIDIETTDGIVLSDTTKVITLVN